MYEKLNDYWPTALLKILPYSLTKLVVYQLKIRLSVNYFRVSTLFKSYLLQESSSKDNSNKSKL